MSVTEIPQSIESLSEAERLRLTARIVLRYPLMNVEPLMGYTADLVARNDWTPPPLTNGTAEELKS